MHPARRSGPPPEGPQASSVLWGQLAHPTPASQGQPGLRAFHDRAFAFPLTARSTRSGMAIQGFVHREAPRSWLNGETAGELGLSSLSELPCHRPRSRTERRVLLRVLLRAPSDPGRLPMCNCRPHCNSQQQSWGALIIRDCAFVGFLLKFPVDFFDVSFCVLNSSTS